MRSLSESLVFEATKKLKDLKVGDTLYWAMSEDGENVDEFEGAIKAIDNSDGCLEITIDDEDFDGEPLLVDAVNAETWCDNDMGFMFATRPFKKTELKKFFN